MNQPFLCFYKKYSSLVVTTTIGIIFFWFGILKILNVCAIEAEINLLLNKITFDLIGKNGTFYLGIFESTVGLLLIFRLWTRINMLLIFFHLLGTFSLFVFTPELVFQKGTLIPNLMGQYGIKNIVYLTAIAHILIQIESKKTRI